jgi:hypothetical protein
MTPQGGGKNRAPKAQYPAFCPWRPFDLGSKPRVLLGQSSVQCALCRSSSSLKTQPVAVVTSRLHLGHQPALPPEGLVPHL